MKREESIPQDFNRRDALRYLGLGMGTLAATPGLARAGAPITPITPANPFDAPRTLVEPSAATLAEARALLFQTFCIRSASQTEGPYYVNTGLVRRNITEGRPGLPVTLFMLIVREADCSPIQGAVVDVWHTDYAGIYSGIPQLGTAGQTFMRGIQTTGADGIVRFETIYPGWYPGCTTHIHVKVRPTPTTVLTTQLYYDQLYGFPGFDLSSNIYRLLPPYSSRGTAQTTNQNDPLFNAGLTQAALLNPDGSLSLWSGLRIALA